MSRIKPKRIHCDTNEPVLTLRCGGKGSGKETGWSTRAAHGEAQWLSEDLGRRSPRCFQQTNLQGSHAPTSNQVGARLNALTAIVWLVPETPPLTRGLAVEAWAWPSLSMPWVADHLDV